MVSSARAVRAAAAGGDGTAPLRKRGTNTRLQRRPCRDARRQVYRYIRSFMEFKPECKDERVFKCGLKQKHLSMFF